MSQDRINVTFTCKKCGGTVIELPDNHTDSSIATCKKCSVKLGRWGDIQAEARRLAEQHVADMARKALSGLKGFKLK